MDFTSRTSGKVFEPLTINVGARFDVVDEFTHANQVSPRFNVVFQATKSTTLHAGYARYFTPPPLELVQSQTLKQFVGTSNRPATLQNSPVQPERANYFDAGMTEQFTRSFSMGVDGYYKISRNLIDEGQFGSGLIFTPCQFSGHTNGRRNRIRWRSQQGCFTGSTGIGGRVWTKPPRSSSPDFRYLVRAIRPSSR